MHQTNALESPRLLTDSSQATAISYTYYPYGESSATVTDSDASANRYRFTGREYETGYMNFYRSRYYNNRMGRFFSKDSWQGKYNRPLSINKYLYVEGNPVNFTDSFGKSLDPGPELQTYNCGPCRRYDHSLGQCMPIPNCVSHSNFNLLFNDFFNCDCHCGGNPLDRDCYDPVCIQNCFAPDLATDGIFAAINCGSHGNAVIAAAHQACSRVVSCSAIPESLKSRMLEKCATPNLFQCKSSASFCGRQTTVGHPATLITQILLGWNISILTEINKGAHSETGGSGTGCSCLRATIFHEFTHACGVGEECAERCGASCFDCDHHWGNWCFPVGSHVSCCDSSSHGNPCTD